MSSVMAKVKNTKLCVENTASREQKNSHYYDAAGT